MCACSVLQMFSPSLNDLAVDGTLNTNKQTNKQTNVFKISPEKSYKKRVLIWNTASMSVYRREPPPPKKKKTKKKRRRKKTKESTPCNTVENNGGIIDDTNKTIPGGKTVDCDVNRTSYDNSNIEKPNRMNSMNAHRTNIQNNSKLAQSHNVATQKQQSAMTQLPAQQQQCPPWALQLMNQVQEINNKFGKLHDIEKSLNHLNIEVHDLDNKVCAMDSRLITVEGCCSFISDQFEIQKNEIKNTQDGITNTKQQCCELERKMNVLKMENVILHDRLTNVEMISMRENIHPLKVTARWIIFSSNPRTCNM